MDQPGRLHNDVSPARRQLNTRKINISACTRSRLRIWSRQSACSLSTLRVNLVRTHRIPPAFRDGVQLYRQLPSGQSRVYQVTQLRTDGVRHREPAGTGQVAIKVVPARGASFLGITMHRLIFVRLSFLTPTTVYWYS